MLTEVLAQGPAGMRQHRKLTARRADDTTFPADVAIDPLLDADGAARSAVLSLHDISEYQLLEDSLRAALEEERRLVELKSRFGMMVSHEFRTPLASIQTSADLLQTYHERLTIERRVEALNTITRQVSHLSAMLDDILAISKADTVGMDYQPAPTDLAELGQSLVEEVRWLDNDRHLLDFTMDENVTPCLLLDRGLLRRALMNLLVNALKYSPQNTVVEFSVKQHDNRIVMTIRDEGIGVPEDELPRLFDSFFRASNVGDVPGTGLGLAIARRAVEAHGGEIRAFSVQGHGSRFQLSFPVRTP
jgi:signal transduction histidine kinase